jgi:hypothetical protein
MSGTKRAREDDDTAAARDVALHYSGRDQQTTAQRQRSPIYNLRCLNNWVRARFDRAAPRVLLPSSPRAFPLAFPRRAARSARVRSDPKVARVPSLPPPRPAGPLLSSPSSSSLIPKNNTRPKK